MKRIQEILPHRYPFLMVDKILEVEKGKYAIGIKNVSNNEAIFQGHFPDNHIFPGALLLEALAQITGIMYAYSAEENTNGKIGYLAAVNSLRFYSIVRPGDQILLKSEFQNAWDNVIQAKVTAYVDHTLIAKGIIKVTEMCKDMT